MELPQPTILPGLSAAPSPPPSGKAAVYARNRAGAPWIDVMRPSGRDFPLQRHFGVNRIANWSPSVTTTITTEGLPITSVGTVSTPTLAATNLAASMRRWRLTSAATVDAAAEQRSAGWACWRGNAAGLGGWTFVTRISLTTLQATGMGFFGLYGSTAALATTLTLAIVVNCIGIGFQRGVRAGDYRRSACQHAIPVAPAVQEQWGHGGGNRLSPLVGRGRQAQAHRMNEEGEARIAAQRAKAMAVIRVRVNRPVTFHLKSADPVLRADIERWMSVAGIRDEPDLDPRLTKAGATSGASVFADRQPDEAWLVLTKPAAGRATALSQRPGTAPPHRPAYRRLSAPRCVALPPASVRGLRHRLRR